MSKPRKLELASMDGAKGFTGRNVIAVIGIDRYDHWQTLSNAVRDATGVLALFRKLGFEEIVEPLFDTQATYKAIDSLVTDDLKVLGPDDSLVLFFAGHGSTQRHQVGGQELKTGYLIPVDASVEADRTATWIKLDGWLRTVSLLPAKHILVILDSCHSGIALAPSNFRDVRSLPDEPPAALRARLSRRVITSALDDQRASDSGPVSGHSLFTCCLLDGLTHGLRGRGNTIVTGSELWHYVRHHVQTLSESKQTPDFGAFNLDDRGEITIPIDFRDPASVVRLPRKGATPRTSLHSMSRTRRLPRPPGRRSSVPNLKEAVSSAPAPSDSRGPQTLTGAVDHAAEAASDRSRRARWTFAVRLSIIIGAAVLVAAGAWRVATHADEPPSSAHAIATPTPIHLIETANPPGSPSAQLRLCGSNTIGGELAPALIYAFLHDKKGCTSLNSSTPTRGESSLSCEPPGGAKLEFHVSTHGSATAFQGLADGTCDLGMASERIPDTVTGLDAARVDVIRKREHVIGLNGIAVIVHPDNALREISKSALMDIFAGNTTSWRSLGGAGGTIHVYALDDNSGTYANFQSLVLGARPLIATARRFEDHKKLSDAVSNDEDGIGFVSLPYIRRNKALMVAASGGRKSLPLPPAIRTEDYMLSTRLYLYGPRDTRDQLASEFVKFVESDTGQAVVAQHDFVDLRMELMAKQACEGCSSAYRSLTSNARRLRVNFRFESGRAELDSLAVSDVERLGKRLNTPELRDKKVILLGFTDSAGGVEHNLQLSRDRAQSVAEALLRYDIPVARVAGFGQDMPVADNQTEDGRRRNRRVEVWLQ